MAQPTHRGGNILDLILTNNPDIFPCIKISPTAFSSHKLVTVQTLLGQLDGGNVEGLGESAGFDTLNFFSELINWEKINEQLVSIDWTTRFGNQNVSKILETFLETCLNIAANNVPTKKNNALQKGKRVPRERKTLMRRRTKLNKSLSNQSTYGIKAKIECELINIEQKLQESYAREEQFNENKAVESINRNSKYFYTYAKKHCKLPPRVGPLEDANGHTTPDPQLMAEILSAQYSSVFSVPMGQVVDTSTEPNPSTDDLLFSEKQIEDAIDELSQNSAAGPDRFPAIFLKKCKNSLAKPLHIMWRRSLDTGHIPVILKSSNITPIYKGGPRQLPKNYRPVALTSHITKIFEKILRSHIARFIESHGFMNSNQHGFRSGRSCLSQLLQHFDIITKLLEEGKNVDVVYLDFGKAFDKLDIKITLQKLFKIGITGKLHRWIDSFLTDRRQTVVVQRHCSAESPVLSGVPQGSVLGPLLFLVMIGDIDDNVISSSVSSFADDTRVLTGVTSTQDVLNLQTDLDTIYNWAQSNNATFNPDKFECLRYGRNQDIITSTSYLSNTQTPIECCSSVRDLGVTMSSDASFSEHISNICSAASLKCGWILRTFKTRDRLPLVTLWKSLVQPILDYCCQLWCPAAAGLIQRIELVQVSYLKKIVGMGTKDYWEQLNALNMYSLERRRERYIAIYMWKVLEGHVPNFGINVIYNKRKGRYCLVPNIRSAAPCRMQTIRFNSMTIKGPRIFNSLPVEIRNKSECSVQSFKFALDKHLKTIPDEPRVGRLIKYCAKASNSLACL